MRKAMVKVMVVLALAILAGSALAESGGIIPPMVQATSVRLRR